MSDLPTLEQFAAMRGERFSVGTEDAGAVQAELIEAAPLRQPEFEGRQPFSLVFVGPTEPQLPQRTYRLAHAGLPQALDVFLVPIGADASGVRYEAVFS